MNKSGLIALATFILGSGAALGQAPTQAPAGTFMPVERRGFLVPDDQPAPTPTAQAPPTPAQPLEQLPTPAPYSQLWDPPLPVLPNAPPPPVAVGSATAGIFSADAEYVLWFLAGARDSATLATSGAPGTAGSGSLGNAVDPLHTGGPASGARLALGYWATQPNFWFPGGVRDFGIETVFFFVGQRSSGFDNEMSPSIYRPFFDLNTHTESAFIVSAPGLSTGGIFVNSQASIWGAEANLWKNVYFDYPGTTATVNLMAGFRYLHLTDQLDIVSSSAFNTAIVGFPGYAGFAGNLLQVSDSFGTHNDFYGGQIGVSTSWRPMPNLIVDGAFKLGLGITNQDLTIAGNQLRTFANGTQQLYQGGLLALPSNIGHYNENRFSQVPELDLKLSVPLTPNLRIYTGFSTLYWNRVLRANQQIDTNIDVAQIPNFPGAVGAPPTSLHQPGVPFRESDLWVLGISVGLEVRY